MEDDNRIGIVAEAILWLIGIGCVACMLFSCSGSKQIEVRDVYHTVHDSVYIHDSIYKEYIQGQWQRDTGMQYIYPDNKVVWLTRVDTIRDKVYADKVINHTGTLINTKEIRVPYPVEKKLTAWQKFRLNSWWWIVGIALVYFCIKYRATVKKFVLWLLKFVK